MYVCVREFVPMKCWVHREGREEKERERERGRKRERERVDDAI